MTHTAGDAVIHYLEALGVEYVFGIPGGAIEPLFDALARSERRGGPKVVVARHETGAAFMADGYARNSGRLGVCCATTGPGATNLITGVASAYENSIPLLVLTAQTALNSFGRRAFQESADTGVNVVGMMQFCTVYNTMVSHIDQFEAKLISAIKIAISESRPTHISVPVDVLRSALNARHHHSLAPFINPARYADEHSSQVLTQFTLKAKKVVFVVGAKCFEAVSVIQKIALMLDAPIVTTPDGKGLIAATHPLYHGVIGFGGHALAHETLSAPDVDLVIAAGTTFGEWSSNGWDGDALLNERLVHIDPFDANLMRSPMARLHVRGNISAVFESLLASLESAGRTVPESSLPSQPVERLDSYREPDAEGWRQAKVKPQWLMRQLPARMPSSARYLADTGNSTAWSIHYLHPYDRRRGERRHIERRRDGDDREFSVLSRIGAGRRNVNAALYQVTVEFSSMGWAIGAAVGAAFADPRRPVVCITGDGSVLMNGQEITVAFEHQLPVIFVVLNDGALGMVKHGQRIAGAEEVGIALPKTDFAAMARAMGVSSYSVRTPEDWDAMPEDILRSPQGPLLLDVRIDGEEVPPIGMRMKVLEAAKAQALKA